VSLESKLKADSKSGIGIDHFECRPLIGIGLLVIRAVEYKLH